MRLGRMLRTGTVMAALALTGCVSLGASRLPADRFDYAERLRESEKSQLLANIVALREGDAPMFLSIASVINQYTRETSGHLDLKISPPGDSDAGGAGGQLLLRETPTITYNPMSGERFARNLLAPMSPASLVAMVEAGWAADDLFRMAIRSINGVRNASRAPLFAQGSEPEFAAVVAALRRLQQSGGLSVRIVEKDKTFAAIARLRANLTPQEQADLAFLQKTLRLSAPGRDVRIVFASEGAPDELAIVTRSMFELLQEMSQGVDLTGRGDIASDALIRVHSGDAAPADAHVSVRRRGRWYWIDGADERSKRVFLLAQVFLSLNDEPGSNRAPLVTIPAG